MSLDQVYPFATQDGKSIPLDIIRPSGLIFRDFIAGTPLPITIPEGYPVAAIISDSACLIKFAGNIGTLIANTLYADLLLVPAGTIIISSVVAGNGAVQGLSAAGTVYIQLIEKWAGLALDKQFTRK